MNTGDEHIIARQETLEIIEEIDLQTWNASVHLYILSSLLSSTRNSRVSLFYSLYLKLAFVINILKP